jgi:pilus assembly protein Flp/PilA
MAGAFSCCAARWLLATSAIDEMPIRKVDQFSLTARSAFGANVQPSRSLAILRQENDMPTIRQFLRDEQAATAIEYSLICAGVALAIVATVQGLGSKLNAAYTSVQNGFN